MQGVRGKVAPCSHEHLKNILKYEPETGNWYWLINPMNGSKPGDRAGCKTGNYNSIGINGSVYRCSNVAWFYMMGEWPPTEIDHINRIKHDDRWMMYAPHNLSTGRKSNERHI